MKETFKYSDDRIKDLLDGIYSGEITQFNIPEDLYYSIADYLKSGVYSGFGGDLTRFGGKDLELLQELRENTYMFSAAKSFQEVKEIGSLMFNENGELRNQREFTQLGEQTFEKWNDAYGRTEYNTAVHNAMMANKWNEIEKNKDLLPFLVYSTIGDACDICAPLDGFTAKVDDPAWSSIYPTNHFNCLCIVTQEEEAIETENKEDVLKPVEAEMQPMFKMNSGQDKVIFSDEHPYFQVDKKDIPFAKENFGLPIPSVDKSMTGLSIPEAQKVMSEMVVSDIEKSALKDYTGEKFNQINQYLGGLRPNTTDENKEIINTLSKFLDRSPKVEADVFRGKRGERAFQQFSTLKKGDIYTEKCFMSTTYDKVETNKFIGSDSFQVLMQIKSKEGVLIEKYSKIGAEKEVLFQKSSNFRVESIKKEGKAGKSGKIFVSLIQI
jgi:hypothetical protein